MQETEFYTWLTDTYDTNDTNLLKTYAAKKTSIPFSQIRDISVYKDAITCYIYETYKYQYNVPPPSVVEEESDDNSMPSLIDSNSDDDNDSLPDLIDLNDDYYLERETITNLNGFRNTNQTHIENILASLRNDIRSEHYFLEIRNNINLYSRRYQQSKKFAIESLLQEHILTEETIDCCICFESYNKSEFVALNCNHEFCNDCLKNAIKSDNRSKPCCAYCRTEITQMVSRTSDIHDKMTELTIK
jgi:hypothetical protein